MKPSFLVYRSSHRDDTLLQHLLQAPSHVSLREIEPPPDSVLQRMSPLLLLFSNPRRPCSDIDSHVRRTLRDTKAVSVCPVGQHALQHFMCFNFLCL